VTNRISYRDVRFSSLFSSDLLTTTSDHHAFSPRKTNSKGFYSSEEKPTTDDFDGVSLPKTQEEYRYKVNYMFDQPKDPRFLQISVLGMPNSGKSTLVNQLVGTKISAVSRKVHTTRKNVLGIAVQGNVQLVFSDSPGLVTSSHCIKHKLEHTFISGPEKSAKHSDLIMVVVDSSNKRERKKLNPGIIQKLDKFSDKEAILVVNKVDLLRKKQKLIDITTLLTTGMVAGKPIFEDNIKPRTIMPTDDQIIAKKVESAEARVRRKGYIMDLPKERDREDGSLYLKDVGLEEDSMQADGEEKVPQDDENEHQETVENETIGWPNFSRVFMVSALTGDGVSDIKDYFLARAYDGKWKFPPDIVTPQNPSALVTLTINEKLLDNLPQEIPYTIKPRIQSWDVNRTGTLCLVVDLIASKQAYMTILLGPQGKTIAKIADETRQELSNAFKCDVSLKMVAKCVQRSRNS